MGHTWAQVNQEEFKKVLKGSPFPQHPLHMMNLVDHASLCEVTDPRDRFFGLRGLAIDLDDDSSLLPDYNKSVKEVRSAYYMFFIR